LPFVLLGIRKNDVLKTLLKVGVLIVLSFIFASIINLAPLIQEANSSKTLISSITRIDSSLELPKSITGRFEFWKVVLKLFNHQPIKGFGLGTFFSAYYVEYTGNEWYSRFAHNHYLQTLVELGIIGLGLLLTFLLISAKNIWKRIKIEILSLFSQELFPLVFHFCYTFF
jgi:O-antigen ligase